VLRWDQPPSLRRVAGVLLAHLGRSITSLGDLDIPGSTARFASAPVGLDGCDARASGSRLSGRRASVLAYRPRSSPPGRRPLQPLRRLQPRVPTTSPVGRSFDCTLRVKNWLEERDRPR
jgi:hypothetical protein